MGRAKDDSGARQMAVQGIRAVRRDQWLAKLQRDPTIAKRWFGTRAEIDAIDEAEQAAWRASQKARA